jgi:acetyl-CoA carboxylase biotin carboxyl carrier protein
MDFSDIERILELVQQHDLIEFELEKEGLKVRVRKGGGPVLQPLHPGTVLPTMNPAAAAPPISAAQTPAASGPAAALEPLDDALELAVVKSPIVGTFYRAPEPGAQPFVEIGERVKKDQVLCIIEAMKLMNEITSEYEGEIVNVYVENGNPVQYGERLFAVKTE